MQSTASILSKDVLKDFTKLTKKHLCWSLIFNKVTGWKPKTVRSRSFPEFFFSLLSK